MITRDDLTLTERHLGTKDNIQSLEIAALLFLENRTTIENPQNQLLKPSDFDICIAAVLRTLYLDIYKDITESLTLLREDPTSARYVLNQLHTKLHNALYP